MRSVVGVGCRAGNDCIIILTEKAGLVVAAVVDGGKVTVDQVVGFGWDQGADGGEVGDDLAAAGAGIVSHDMDSDGMVAAACLQGEQTLLVASLAESLSASSRCETWQPMRSSR